MMFFVKECSFVSILLTKELLSVVYIECFITAIYDKCFFIVLSSLGSGQCRDT